MKYVDLHCDTLTACFDAKESLASFNGQISLNKLKESGCAAQCLAIFTDGVRAAENFENYIAFYKSELAKLNDIAAPIDSFTDLKRCEKDGKTGIILTVENLGFIGEDLQKISVLKQEGVKMASLVWNNKNQFASPNLKFKDGVPQFEAREEEGLTPLGGQAVELLDFEKIIVDISHLSDGGAREILQCRKTPVVASHSNAQGVLNVCRNLSDELVKKIAGCGGVIGVNFCKDFLGSPAFGYVLKHVNRLIKVGGEDVIALGSDFDGIPVNPEIESCARVPALLDYLQEGGLPYKTVEKLAYKNFFRVFKEVCG